MSFYSSYFQQLKQGRSLEWMGNVGRVTLEIEMDEIVDEDGTKEKKVKSFVVSPEKASVVYLFQEKGEFYFVITTVIGMFLHLTLTYDTISNLEEWKLAEVVSELEMETSIARSSLQFWCKRRVLSLKSPDSNESEEVYTVEKEQSDKKQNGEFLTLITKTIELYLLTNFIYLFLHFLTAYDSIEAGAPARDDGTEEMRVYWSYIVGMLTNLGAVPLPKMHSFLKMLVPADTPYTKSAEELKAFLDVMVDEEKLIIVGEAYKLVK